MIRLSNVAFDYASRPTLTDLSLEIQSGEFVGIMGPNSAGKSTLLKLMSRELSPSRGRIELKERDLRSWPLRELAQVVTVVSSEESFAFPFTVEQIVLMGRIPYLRRGSGEGPEDHRIAEEAMAATDVLALRHRCVHQLSSGERQRVLLARALAQEPQLLLLDEPSVHLDIGHAWGFFQLLKRLHAERNLTVVCALHDLALAKAFCSRLVMLHQGHIHTQGAAQAVLNSAVLEAVFGIEARSVLSHS